MHTHEYSPRPRLFVTISSLAFLTLLLAACGGPSTSGGSVTPTPGKTATLQTSCPPNGTARAAVMTPLALGKQGTFVYIEGKQPPEQQPTTYTLKRYTVSTRTTTAILSVPDTMFFGAQISADGQWVMLNPFVSGQRAIQLVRSDGQGLQTLYCGRDSGWLQWSPDNNYVAFVDMSGQDPSTWTFKLLNGATGAIQTKPHDSTHVLDFPLAWLDNSHLYVGTGAIPGEGSNKLSLLDITTGTIKEILDLSPPDQCIDATHSIDGTQLFTSITSQCHVEGYTPTSNGPSSIEVQSATGGPAKTIFSTPTDAIKAFRVATGTNLLLIMHNASTQTSHNGLWKVNTDGTGLTMLSSEAAIIKDAANEEVNFIGLFGWNMDQPWANASRDGAYYFMQVNNHAGNGSSRLLIGSMNGGVPVTIVSGPVEAPVGWTTM
jgi:eukaryotic-like serine/threonine-protein kinase